jgi:hypothetical protein
MRLRAGIAAAALHPDKQPPQTDMAYTPPPEVVALIRRRYQEGAPIKAICAESGISNLNIFYRCLKGHYPDGTGLPPAPIAKRRTGIRVRHREGSRTALVARMWRTAERQVEDVEERAAIAGLELAEREGNARILAVVSRTVRELTAADAAGKPRGKDKPKDNDDGAVPRNLEELRRELTKKLEAFAAGGDPASGEPGPGADGDVSPSLGDVCP